MKKFKLKKTLLICLFGILLVIFILMFCQSSNFYWDAYNNQKDIDTIIKEVTDSQINEETKEEEFKVNFEELLKINKDVKGWIRFNQISYPILQGKERDSYLNTTIYGKQNSLGSIFMDYRNISFDDKNVVIFGHNAANGTMFGSLKNIFQKDYFVNNEQIIEIIDINDNVLKYEIFSYYVIPKEEYYITTSFNSDKEYLEFLKTIKKRSQRNFNVSLTENDKILTLSTCNGHLGSDKRTVIHARLLP